MLPFRDSFLRLMRTKHAKRARAGWQMLVGHIGVSIEYLSDDVDNVCAIEQLGQLNSCH